MTACIETLTNLGWTQIWQVTVTALLVEALVQGFCRHRPRLAYALWMVVIIKCLLPPFLSCPISIFSRALAESSEPRPSVVTDYSAIQTVHTSYPNMDRPGAARGIAGLGSPESYGERDWDQIRFAMTFIWLFGLLCLLFLVVGRYILCTVLIRYWSIPVPSDCVQLMERLSRKLGVRSSVGLIVTSKLISPAVFGGCFRPTILIPGAVLGGMDQERLEHVLTHELTHIKRGDILMSKLQLVAQLLFWFHPLVWRANRRANDAREPCTDGDAVWGIGCEPRRYAETLIHFQALAVRESQWQLPAAVPGMRAIEVTSPRLEYIMMRAKNDLRSTSRLSRIIFTTAVGMLLLPGAGLTLEAEPPVDGRAYQTPTQAERQPIDPPLAGLWPAKLPAAQRFTCNGRNCYLWVLSKATGLALLLNEVGDPPTYGRVFADRVEAFNMIAPITCGNGVTRLEWPAGPGPWISAGPVDLSSDARVDLQRPMQRRVIVQKFFINGRPCFIYKLDRGGLALFLNEHGDSPSFGLALEDQVLAFNMTAPISRRDGMITIEWPAGDGVWQRSDIGGSYYITKNGHPYPCEIVPLDDGDYLVINEQNHPSARLCFRSVKIARVESWKLDVSVQQNGIELFLVYNNTSVWQKPLARTTRLYPITLRQ